MACFAAQLKNNVFISSDLFPLVLDCHLEESHQDGSHSLIASTKGNSLIKIGKHLLWQDIDSREILLTLTKTVPILYRGFKSQVQHGGDNDIF